MSAVTTCDSDTENAILKRSKEYWTEAGIKRTEVQRT